jgi:hypothetical protein
MGSQQKEVVFQLWGLDMELKASHHKKKTIMLQNVTKGLELGTLL